MKKTILIFISIFLVFGPSFAQTILNKSIKSTSLTAPKLMVGGNVAYIGTASRIQSSLHFHYGNRPLTNLIVRINNLILKEDLPGRYQIESRWNTGFKIGDTMVITAESKDPRSPFRSKVIVGTYKIKYHIKMIFPKHNQEIDLSENLPVLKMRWDIVNYSNDVGLFIKKIGDLGYLVDIYLNTNGYHLNSNLLLPSAEYKINLHPGNLDSRIGYFKLSKLFYSNASEIEFRYWNVSKFKTK
ncbi:MAG: hypothetical protein ABFR36_08665 [Acidobacteriota bacterium]